MPSAAPNTIPPATPAAVTAIVVMTKPKAVPSTAARPIFASSGVAMV
jgi:hypothetical protein